MTLIEPNDYLNAHQRAREGGFRVVSLLAGSPGKGRAVFRGWMQAIEAAPVVVTAPAPDYETAKRALDYGAAGAALEIVPSQDQFIDAMATALSFIEEWPERPIAVISPIAAIEVAVTAQSVDVGLQHAVFGGLIPLAAGVAEQVERFSPKPRIPNVYRSIHEYVLHVLIQHDRTINVRFLANHRVAGSRKHYEIDLWCERLRLAIEVDGIQHFAMGQKQLDQARDADLAAAGIKTQRILASAVMSDPSKALMLVRQTVDSRTMEISQ
jgi:very-short-patch-repair endonuclease